MNDKTIEDKIQERQKETETIVNFIRLYHQSWKEDGCTLCHQRRGANDIIYKMLLDLEQKKLMNHLKNEEATRWIEEVKKEHIST